MIKSLALAIAAWSAAIILIAATRPDTFRFERSISIQPPEKVFALVIGFYHWKRWSSWENIDPAIRSTCSGTASGKGAVYEWSGNNQARHGCMNIVELVAPGTALFQIQFIKPFEARNTVEFNLRPQGSGITVTQAVYGPSPFISKLMSLFFSIEKMVGQNYEEGLASLKAVAEQ